MTGGESRTGDPGTSAPAHRDGGAWSLLGYLYQLLGSAATHVEMEQTRIQEGDADSLVFAIEENNQDAKATRQGVVKLIQFKHSEEKRDITPGELAAVLTTLDKSTESLNPRAQRVEWILQTNRPLSLIARELFKGHKPAKMRGTDPKNVEAIGRLRSRLEIRDVPFDDYETTLHNRARKFGVSPGDLMVEKVSAYLLSIAKRPRGSRTVRLEDLDEKLTGIQQPLMLHAPACKAWRTQELQGIARELLGPGIDDCVDRDDVRKLLATPGIALAAVIGPGGSGKTLSVLRAMDEVLGRRDCLAGALMPGPAPKQMSFEQLVASWRSRLELEAEKIVPSFDRLATANNDIESPFLLLMLDGLDESEWDVEGRRHAENLVAHFFRLHQEHRQPKAVLVVTCRTRDQLDEIVGPEGTGGPEPIAPEVVELGEFSDREFSRVWGQWFRGEPEPRLADNPGELATMEGEEPVSPSEARVARALRHPVLLGCAKRLTIEDRRQLIRAGERGEAWRKLLVEYLRWFTKKVDRRRKCGQDAISAVLRAAAHSSHPGATPLATFDRETHWTEPGAAETDLPRLTVRKIFEDAVTAGIIDASGLPRFAMPAALPVRWKWHFEFVAEYLRGLA